MYLVSVGFEKIATEQDKQHFTPSQKVIDKKNISKSG
jgi:hypothetical protein